MFSIENPPDHSRSSEVTAPKNDDRISDDRVAPIVVDLSGLPKNQTPDFSIRNYAFTLRRKDIGASWPFQQQHLELCLKHGVKDLLPPFEPPALVRACTSTKRKRYEQLTACIDNTISPEVNRIQEEPFNSLDRVSRDFHHDSQPLSDPSVLEHSDQIYRSLPMKSKDNIDKKGLADAKQNQISLGGAEIQTTACVHDHVESTPCSNVENLNSDIISGSEGSLEAKTANVPYFPGKIDNTQKLSKKCRLVVKIGAIPEPPRAADISSNSGMVSDSMASKVCPVCKTFSSTSNTTLNAHIDQCLSVENDTQLATVKRFGSKIKPRMKRLMVDIYATAACCTLEDLDRRNGTSWASDSCLISPSNTACHEIERSKHGPVSPADDENEGAVYVDSKGTKLCILSKLSTSPSDTVGESSNAKSLGKKFEEPRKVSLSKNTRLVPMVSKKMKLKQQCKKRHSARLLHQINATKEDKACMLINKGKEESLAKISSAQEKHRNEKAETLMQNIRSQHSGEPREENGQSTLKKSDSRKLSVKNSPMNLTSPPAGFSPLKTKGMNFLSSTVPERQQKEKKMNSLKMKLPKSLGGYNTSPRIKRVESSKIVQGSFVAQEIDKVYCMEQRTSVACHAVPPDDNKLIQEKSSSLTKLSSLSADPNFHANEVHFSSKKLRTYRPPRKSGKESSGASGISQGHDVSGGNYQACVTNQSSCHLDIMDENANISAQTSSRQSDYGKAIKDTSFELSGLEDGCKHTDGKRNSPIDRLADVYNAQTSPLDNSADDHANTNTVSSEDQMVSFDASMHALSSLEDNEKLIGGTEAWVELFAPRSSMNQGDESCNAVSTSNAEMASQLEFSEKVKSRAKLQHAEYQVPDAVVGQVPNACLTSPRVVSLEMYQENSCVTSNKTFMNDEHNRESSGSPMSASSTISHPTTGDAKDREPRTPAATNDKSKCEVHGTYISPEDSRHLNPLNVEGHVPGPEAVAVAHDPVKTQNELSYCCLHGESSPHEFPCSSKGKVEELMVPSTSSFNSKPTEPPLYSLHPNFRFESAAVGSFSSMSALNVAVGYPMCKDLGASEPSPRTQSQGCSKPVLRLMGTNVMILNKEENMSLQEEPPCPSVNHLNTQYPPLLNQLPRGNTVNLINQQSHNPQFEDSRTMEYDSINMRHVSSPLSADMRMNAFMGTTLRNGMKVKDLQKHQIRPHRASDSPFTFNVGNRALHCQYQQLSCATWTPRPRVIGDKPGIEACPTGSQPISASAFSSAFSGTNYMPLIPMAHVPLQGTYHHPRELHYGAKPRFPVSVPGANVHAMMQGNPSGVVGSFLSGKFVGPSISSGYHPTPHFYSPSLQQQ